MSERKPGPGAKKSVSATPAKCAAPPISGGTTTGKPEKLTLRVIAARISAHLRRFEKDRRINKRERPGGTLTYWLSGAGTSGRYVWVMYVLYQRSTNLSKSRAIEYLNWLDAGNIGKHWEMK